jgi:hypothetical protein
MAFFARPNLDDTQFKQLSGSTLTLSGDTQIAKLDGLSILTSGSTYVPIIVTGATDYKVLTYLSGKITLQPVAGGGSGIYSGATPSTCTVGGLSAGTTIYGCSISCILEEILVPTLNPTLTLPSNTFIIIPSTSPLEIGTSISLSGCSTFDRGCICPQYTSLSDKRSGCACSYDYNSTFFGTTGVTSSLPSNLINFGAYNIAVGDNTVSGSVTYLSGTTVKNSAGGTYLSGLTSGNTITCSIIYTAITRTISGIYPYYWGKVTCACPAGVDQQQVV